jgi:hypothetical protein
VARAAEQLPLAMLPQLAAMKDGSALFSPSAGGATVIYVLASRAQPVDLERATKAIDQFLFNERRRVMIADDLKALRAGAKIEYAGKYAASAPATEAIKGVSPAEVAASAAAQLGTTAVIEGMGLRVAADAARAAAAADANIKPASSADNAAISKGLGFK